VTNTKLSSDISSMLRLFSIWFGEGIKKFSGTQERKFQLMNFHYFLSHLNTQLILLER